MEGREKADEIANNWCENPGLFRVKADSELISDGKSISWKYMYIDKNHNEDSELSIRVYADGEIIINHPTINEERYTTENWTIDSTKAFKSASENSKIKEFVNEHENARVISMNLIYSPNDKIPTWVIKWSYSVLYETPDVVEIHISATSGKVIESFATGS
jgi:hypothetical protein